MNLEKYGDNIITLVDAITGGLGSDDETFMSQCSTLESVGLLQEDDALVGFARFKRGEKYYISNEMVEFYTEMVGCLEPFERAGEWEYLARANNLLGIVSMNRGNAPFAMDYYSKALTYCRQHGLKALEIMMNLNIGSLFLTVDECDEAIGRFQNSYEMTETEELDPDEYYSYLSAAMLGLSKAMLRRGDMHAARDMFERLLAGCEGRLEIHDELAVNCFGAILYKSLGDFKQSEAFVSLVGSAIMDEIPVMDVFDDVYDYLSMLSDSGQHSEFDRIVKALEALVIKTNVKNLERRLVQLQLQNLRARGRGDDYSALSERFFELYETTERENHMMIRNMLRLRGSFNDLARINREVEEENRLLQKKSVTDPLTQMDNRAALNGYAGLSFERARRADTGWAIEILDIDYFKEYNDNYGHQAGDECISFVANQIKELRQNPGVFTARYGGDEFVVIYEGYSDTEVFDMAKDLKERILKRAVEHKFTKSFMKIVTVSQGIFWGKPTDGTTAWNFLHAADALLYRAKNKSRNSIMLGHVLGDDDEKPWEG